MILDCCRDFVYQETASRTIHIPRAKFYVDDFKEINGTYIVFACAANAQASDSGKVTKHGNVELHANELLTAITCSHRYMRLQMYVF